MKTAFLAFLLCLTAIQTARASSPGLGEGPPGCDWRAAVTDMRSGDEVSIEIKLMQLVGTCMYSPGPCGKKDQLVSVQQSKSDIRNYRVGQIIKVWVVGDKVSFEQPQCFRTPGQGAK